MVKPLSDLETNPRNSETLRNVLNEFMQFVFTRTQENIIANKSVNTGFLLRSGSITEEEGKVTIEYTAPYAVFIEYGTDPHPVSGKMLVSWVKRKLGYRDKKALSVAWAIAMKISKHGTEPKPWARPAINEGIRKYGVAVTPLKM